MAIITQPPEETLTAYRPILFEVQQPGNPTLVFPENAVVTLYVEGVAVSTFRVKVSNILPTVDPFVFDYSFCIDVSERMRNVLAPSAEIPSVFVIDCPTAPVLNTDSIKQFYLDITYEYLDVNTGLILPIPIIETTDIFSAANITRQHLESMFFGEFFYVFPTLGRYLSNGPNIQTVCREDSVFYSILNDGISFLGDADAIKVILYDAAGANIGEAIYLLPFPGAPVPSTIHTINAGIENGLKCLVAFQQTPSYDLDNPLIDCYTIEAGLSAGYLQTREAIKYKLDCSCCEKRRFRLHWLNLLGGVDSYTFCSVKELRQKSTAIIAEKSLNWIKGSLTPHNVTDVGPFKTQTTTEERYRIVSKSITPAVAEWLKELYSSVKVYAELETGVFVPVIIEDSDILVNKETGKLKLEITIRLAYCIINQSV
jgi:hypothetical protein